MKDILIYHPYTENYIGVSECKRQSWSESRVVVFSHDEIKSESEKITWVYSNIIPDEYGIHRLQGIYHKSNLAMLAIDGTGEEPGPAITLMDSSTSFNGDFFVVDVDYGLFVIIWPPGKLYLSIENESDDVKWVSNFDKKASCFQFRDVHEAIAT